MKDCTPNKDHSPEKNSWSVLEQIAREGAYRLLQQALEKEVEEYLKLHQSFRNEEGRQVVVRNGYMPERDLVTGIGPISIKQPRVDDRQIRKNDEAERFSSKILPRYMRRVPSVDNLIPVLYLKGVSTGDFSEALVAILGEGVRGLSATNIVRLKQSWETDYQEWSKREFGDKEYVYLWADGIYVNVRLEDERSCLLVIMGATREGKKELIAVSDGFRESTLSWKEILLDIKRRGLKMAVKLAIGDGALGFWGALREVYPETKRQRCWVHKTANILDKLPKSIQGKAKSMIHEMYMAESKQMALQAYEHFNETFEDKYPKAVNCLTKDFDDLFTFYDFPSAHWGHIRTTNPIESTFATVRLRTKRTKGCGSRIATLTMVFKLCQEAEKKWQRLKGYKLIPFVMKGQVFIDGELKKEIA